MDSYKALAELLWDLLPSDIRGQMPDDYHDRWVETAAEKILVEGSIITTGAHQALVNACLGFIEKLTGEEFTGDLTQWFEHRTAIYVTPEMMTAGEPKMSKETVQKINEFVEKEITNSDGFMPVVIEDQEHERLATACSAYVEKIDSSWDGERLPAWFESSLEQLRTGETGSLMSLIDTWKKQAAELAQSVERLKDESDFDTSVRCDVSLRALRQCINELQYWIANGQHLPLEDLSLDRFFEAVRLMDSATYANPEELKRRLEEKGLADPVAFLRRVQDLQYVISLSSGHDESTPGRAALAGLTADGRKQVESILDACDEDEARARLSKLSVSSNAVESLIKDGLGVRWLAKLSRSIPGKPIPRITDYADSKPAKRADRYRDLLRSANSIEVAAKVLPTIDDTELDSAITAIEMQIGEAESSGWVDHAEWKKANIATRNCLKEIAESAREAAKAENPVISRHGFPRLLVFIQVTSRNVLLPKPADFVVMQAKEQPGDREKGIARVNISVPVVLDRKNPFGHARKIMIEAFQNDDDLWRAYRDNIAMTLHDRHGITAKDKRDHAAADIMKLIFETVHDQPKPPPVVALFTTKDEGIMRPESVKVRAYPIPNADGLAQVVIGDVTYEQKDGETFEAFAKRVDGLLGMTGGFSISGAVSGDGKPDDEG